MPIYEYRCQACGAELEKLQKISDPPLSECPECGKEALVKLVSASSFRLKGGGWYESDFKTGKKKNGVGDADIAGSSTTVSDISVGDSGSKSADSSSGKAETSSGNAKADSSKNSASSST